MASALQDKAAEVKETLLSLFDSLVVPDPLNGDSPIVADVASAIITRILSSEDYGKLQALKDKVEQYIADNQEFLSAALKESIEQIFITCVERLSALCKAIRSVTSSANIENQRALDFEFHPRKDSGAEEDENEKDGSWLEVTVPT